MGYLFSHAIQEISINVWLKWHDPNYKTPPGKRQPWLHRDPLEEEWYTVHSFNKYKAFFVNVSTLRFFVSRNSSSSVRITWIYLDLSILENLKSLDFMFMWNELRAIGWTLSGFSGNRAGLKGCVCVCVRVCVCGGGGFHEGGVMLSV